MTPLLNARRVPGEWEPHSLTYVSWPTRREVWDPLHDEAEGEFLALICMVALDEPVVVICRGSDRDRIQRLLPVGCTTLVHPIDDGWIRDNGPIGVVDSGVMLAVDFGFNSWGERFAPWAGDASVGITIARHAGVVHDVVPFVLEGGAVSFNGNGVALVVEECVLNPSRNGRTSRKKFESILGTALGVDTVIWLPFGLLEDLKNTDGHVDNVAVWVSEDHVVAQEVPPSNPNFERLEANLAALGSARFSDGRTLNISTVPVLPYVELPDGSSQPSPYINFALTSSQVILPTVGRKDLDSVASRIFEALFPGRRVSFTASRALTHGGGGPHCVTMQWPLIDSRA